MLTVFIGFCGAMAYCASNLEQDFDQRWFVPSDAKLWDAFDVDEEYFKDSGALATHPAPTRHQPQPKPQPSP